METFNWFSCCKGTKKKHNAQNFLWKKSNFLLRKKLKCTIHTPFLLFQCCKLQHFLLILHPLWKNKLLTS